jgi:hypothetical protein
MTVEKAIDVVRNAGQIEAVGGKIHCRVPTISTPELDAALAALRRERDAALVVLSGRVVETEPLEDVLKGHAVEMWSDSAGHLFLVADEEDVQLAMERYRLARGEIYSAAEVRRIVEIADPRIVSEIHTWKRKFDAVVSEFREGLVPTLPQEVSRFQIYGRNSA